MFERTALPVPAMMHTVHTFLTSKDGEPREDCEDSIHPSPGCAAGDDPLGAFAVSDGVTTSFFGGLWARALTARFAECPAAVFEQLWAAWLMAPQEQWQAAVRERAAAATASFYTCNDVLSRRPAAATFVGMLLDPPAPDGAIPWRALVLGDSCLFILGQTGPRSLALTKSAEFSNIVSAAESYACDQGFSPQLYGTAPHGSEPPLAEGDTVLLATDALSKWLLLRAEAGQPVWGTILGLAGQAEFEALVEQARREDRNPLENDDVALGIVRFGPPHAHYLDARFEPQSRPDPPPRVPGPEPSPPALALLPPETPSTRDLPGRLSVPSAGVRRSPWLGLALLGVILTLAAALIWQAEADTREVKKKLARVQAELSWSDEKFRRVSRELEAKTLDLASHRKERETQRADSEKALRQAERAGAESERKAEITRHSLQEAQAHIKSLEAGQQALNEKLLAYEQELKALREHPTPPPPLPDDPPANLPPCSP